MARRARSGEMSLVQHLQEARRRFLLSVLAAAVMTAVGFLIYPYVLDFLQRPYCAALPGHCRFLATSPLDGISVRMKISFAVGIVGAAPVWVWHIWRFVTPGLRARERRFAIPFILSVAVFFTAGGALGYYIFPRALEWLASIGGQSLNVDYNPNQYLTLIILVIVIFGITFEFPVILVALELARVVTSRQLLRFWRYSVIGIVIFAGVVTPSSDPFSMLALMVPLIIFYFLAIAVGRMCHR